MKMVFTDPSVVPCDMLKGMLEGSGIRVLIKNELGSAGIGLGSPIPHMISLSCTWPEVWVADDDYAVAAAMVADLKQRQMSAEVPWTCKRCGESVDAELSACWKCDAPRPAPGADPAA